MTRKTKIFGLIGIGLIIIIAIILIFIFSQRQVDPVIEDLETAPVEKIEVTGGDAEIIKNIEVTKADKMASAVKPVAIAFVERFGTFTNHSGFVSLKDLSPILTESMISWVSDVYIPKLEKERDPSGFFYRITAKAPVVLILGETDTTVKVKVTAQRSEAVGDNAPIEFLQDIELEMIKINNEWLVDAAFWKERR
jgi:hypothetical protein